MHVCMPNDLAGRRMRDAIGSVNRPMKDLTGIAFVLEIEIVSGHIRRACLMHQKERSQMPSTALEAEQECEVERPK